MGKTKDTVEELRSKLFERKKEEIVETEKKLVEENLECVAYDIIQNPNKKRDYLIVRIKYNLETKEAVVTDVEPFHDKAAGLGLQLDKKNRKYFFDKVNRGKK